MHQPLGILSYPPNLAGPHKCLSHSWRSSKTLTCFWSLLGRPVDEWLCGVKSAQKDESTCLGALEATLTSSELDLGVTSFLLG